MIVFKLLFIFVKLEKFYSPLRYTEETHIDVKEKCAG